MKNTKIYYGWVVVAAGFIIFAVSFAIPFSFSVFLKPLQETFGWSRETVSAATTINLIVYGACIVPAGWAMDRFSPRSAFSVAALLIGSSLFLCSRVSQPWQFYLFYGLPLGIGMGICGPPILSIIARWFVQKRGIALGITGSGVGLGTLMGAPISNLLISAYGWRTSYLILGVASGVIILVCAYYMSSQPQIEASQNPAASLKHQSEATVKLSGMTFRQAIQSREMLLLMLTQITAMFTLRIVQVHIVAHATDVGVSPSVAALLVSTIGVSSILGRLVMGLAQDKMGAKASIIICLTIQGIAMLALPLITTDSLFFIFAWVFGFTYGGDMPQVAAISAQCFGMASIGLTYGLVMAIGNMTGATGPIIAGRVFDVYGSYTAVFLAGAVGLFAGVLCMWKLKPRG